MSHLTQNRTLQMVEIVIVVLSGLGGLFALISILARKAWLSTEMHERLHAYTQYPDLNQCETSCLLAIGGTICCLIATVIGIVRILKRINHNARSCKTAQFVNLIAGFLGLLSSVAIWADFLRHFPGELKLTPFIKSSYNVNNHENNHNHNQNNDSNYFYYQYSQKLMKDLHFIHTDVIILFGWAYWFIVIAVLFLFFSNLIYLMRKDCETQNQINNL